jgi:hypothetical protein
VLEGTAQEVFWVLLFLVFALEVFLISLLPFAGESCNITYVQCSSSSDSGNSGGDSSENSVSLMTVLNPWQQRQQGLGGSTVTEPLEFEGSSLGVLQLRV